MNLRQKQTGRRRWRWALAWLVSLGLHTCFLWWITPRYRPVADIAVPFEVVELTEAGPSAAPPLAPPVPVPSPEVPAPRPPEPEPAAAPKVERIVPKPVVSEEEEPDKPAAAESVADKERDSDVPERESVSVAPATPDSDAGDDLPPLETDSPAGDSDTDGGALASGTDADTDTDTDTSSDTTGVALTRGSAAGEGALCMPDLFPLVQRGPAPSWLLWISMGSFRGTAWEAHIDRAVGAFDLARRLSAATGFEPVRDLDGLLVTAEDVFDANSYSVVARHRHDAEGVRQRVDKRRERGSGFRWFEVEGGYRGHDPRGFTWTLAEHSRLLRIESRVAKSVVAGAEKLADNPYAAQRPAEGAAGTDVLPANEQRGPDKSDVGAVDLRESLPPVKCLAPRPGTPPEPALGSEGLGGPLEIGSVTRSVIAPDAGGHMPTVVISSSDPVTIGLPRQLAGLGLEFRFAAAQLFFGERRRLEGAIYFAGSAESVARLAALWRTQAAQLAQQPAVKLLGLGSLAEKLRINSTADRISFEIEVSESQVRSLFLLLERQARIVDRRLQAR